MSSIAQAPGLTEVLVHTGQHIDANMSDVFFTEPGMNKPDYFLDTYGGAHDAMTGRMLEAIEQVMLKDRPDIVLVYGDTNSTLAGALAAAKLLIAVAHVEPGLRSVNMQMPEELNRILTDRISQWLFTLIKATTANLQRECYSADKIIKVGAVMYDVGPDRGSCVQPDTGRVVKLGLKGRKWLATCWPPFTARKTSLPAFGHHRRRANCDGPHPIRRLAPAPTRRAKNRAAESQALVGS